MAKSDDDKELAIDEDSLQFLEQVRKGKARNFVMSVKGAKVQSLLVKKKKLKDKEIKEARGGGFQPMFGVVEGQGNNLTFKIAISDGFEKDPLGGKVAKLKEFLKNQTGKAYKPTVEVVSTPPAIPFDEEDLKHPSIARFMSLTELIQQVVTQHPDAEQPVLALVNEIRGLLQEEETIGNADPRIDELENLLHSFEVDQSAPVTQAQPEEEAEPSSEVESAPVDEPPAPPQRSELANKLAEGLKKLKPAVQEAIKAVPDQKDALLKSMTEVVADIKAENLDAAKVNMVALGKQIQEIRANAPARTEAPSQNQDEQLARKLAEALKKLKPAAEKIIQAMPDRKAELIGAIAKIAGEIKSKDYATAKQSIAEFAPQLKQMQLEATGSTASPEQDQWPNSRLRRQRIEPDFLEACRIDFEKKSEFQMIWSAADEKANQGDFAAANQMLSRLEEKIRPILAGDADSNESSPIPEGVVAFRQARIAWGKHATR